MLHYILKILLLLLVLFKTYMVFSKFSLLLKIQIKLNSFKKRCKKVKVLLITIVDIINSLLKC